jgi:epoxyqueuosine reductase
VKFSRATERGPLAPREHNREPDLAELLLLSEEQFRSRFARSPVRRAKRRGLARNTAIALGNRRDVRDIPALTHALENDDDPIVRGHAAWALGRFAGNSGAYSALQRALENEEDSAARREIELSLR